MCRLHGNDPNYTVMNPSCHDPTPPQLWILDIDGTLMPSHAVDNDCYWQAVNDCFGDVPTALDLRQFRHVTDGSILNEWMEKTHARAATEAEISGIRRHFLELLEQAFARDAQAFTAMPGLVEWLELQLERHGNCIAIATGGWGHSARFKLRAARLDRFNFPLASSDDGHSRTDIMLKARDHLFQDGTANHNIPIFYIGDGVWDYQASCKLDWDFVGIAEGQRAKALRDAGAKQVYCNFKDWTASKPTLIAARKPLQDART